MADFLGFLHLRQHSLPLSVSRERGLWVVMHSGYELLGLKLGLSLPHWRDYSKYVREGNGWW